MFKLTDKETKLIEFIRKLEYGEIKIEVQRGEPVIGRTPLASEFGEAVKTVKF
jgi:hypothetical protein